VQITLQYTASGSEFTRIYEVAYLKGFDDPDEFQIFGVQNRYLNGSIDEQILGFRRVITVDFGVLQDYTDKEFLSRFIANPDREIRRNDPIAIATESDDLLLAENGDTLITEIDPPLFVNVSLENPSAFSNRWEEDLVIGKRFVLRLISNDIDTIFSIGTGYGFDYGVAYGTGL
jgi:hypothetical protein